MSNHRIRFSSRYIILGLFFLIILGGDIAPICRVGAPSSTQLSSEIPHPAADPVIFDVVDIRGLNFNASSRWVLTSLEGHANKNSVRLYIISGSGAWNWLQSFNNTEYVGYSRTVTSLVDIIQPYASEFAGLIIFDPGDGEMGNIATPLAGVYTALLVPQDLYDWIHASFPSLPILKNVTAELQAAGATYPRRKIRVCLCPLLPPMQSNGVCHVQRGCACQSPRIFGGQ